MVAEIISGWKTGAILMLVQLAILSSCGQSSRSTTDAAASEKITHESKIGKTGIEKEILDITGHIYNDSIYSDTGGELVRIQNSWPRGGGVFEGGIGYTDATGRHHGHAMFWTRIINITSTPLDFSIEFPRDSLVMGFTPNSYTKLFLPSESMSSEKVDEYNYGISSLRPFLDTAFFKQPQLQMTIEPNDEKFFYVAMLSYEAGGTPRAGMFCKEKDLFYACSIEPHGSITFPCGKITLKD